MYNIHELSKIIQFDAGRTEVCYSYPTLKSYLADVIITAVVLSEKKNGLCLVLLVDHSTDLGYLYEIDADAFNEQGIMGAFDKRDNTVPGDRLESFWNVSTEYGSSFWELRKKIGLELFPVHLYT